MNFPKMFLTVFCFWSGHFCSIFPKLHRNHPETATLSRKMFEVVCFKSLYNNRVVCACLFLKQYYKLLAQIWHKGSYRFGLT